MGIVAPLVEASIGVGLLTRYRNWAVILALGRYAFILLCLGPLGHDWNTVVWPWNVAMATFVVLLFWRTGDISPKKILLPTRRRPSYLHAVVLVLFAVMPLFGLFGLWDSYLSASLYSGNNERGALFVSGTVKDRLPAEIREHVADVPAGEKYALNLYRWSYEELNVPPYLEARVFRNVARHVCSYAGEPSGGRLEIQGRSVFSSGGRKVWIYNCSGVETGEHETVKLAE